MVHLSFMALKYFKSQSLHFLIAKNVLLPLRYRQSISPYLLVFESHGSSTRVKFSYWRGEIEAETLQPQKQAV